MWLRQLRSILNWNEPSSSIDKNGGVLKEDGFSFEEVKDMFVKKNGNKLNNSGMLPFSEINGRIWKLGADIFIPGAASKLVTRSQVDDMIAGGLEVLAAGANVPFVDDQIFFGPTAHYADSKFSMIPDFIANCGMARVFAYFMEPDVPMTDKAIFGDVSKTIRQALKDIYEKNQSMTHISKTALEIALTKLL